MSSELSPGQPNAPPDGQEWPVWSAALTSLSPGGGEGGWHTLKGHLATISAAS